LIGASLRRTQAAGAPLVRARCGDWWLGPGGCPTRVGTHRRHAIYSGVGSVTVSGDLWRCRTVKVL
jgi:hypothetical protein